VVIYHTDRLHKGADEGGTDKVEFFILQHFAHCLGFGEAVGI
tara:strand:- start:5288 stop:5413 length:126 start_codon:yes stop_codon:yes gene_type:complete